MKKVHLYFLMVILWLPGIQVKAEDWVYTTRPDDSLWSFSQQYLKSVDYWPKLQKYNNIKNPKLLPPGYRLHIPISWLKNQPAPAVVVAVNGLSHVKHPENKTPVALKVGMKITIESEIVTENATIVVLKFADDSRLIIQQNSTVSMNMLTAHGSNGMVDTRIRLQKGRVESQVNPLKNKDSRFEITTPAAVASVRGTKFRVSMNPKSATMFSEVVEGEVAVASQGVTRSIPTGFGTKVVQGQPPLEAQPLLPIPNLSNIPPTFFSEKLELSWPPMTDAKQYHVEIARSTQFINVLLDKVVLVPGLTWNTDLLGDFAVRVRGISQIGSEGLDGIHEFSTFKSLPSPKLVSPKNNLQLDRQNFTFQWLGHSDVTRFLLQVSTNANFENNLIEVSGNQQYYSVTKKLPSGKYYWRVMNEYEKGIRDTASKTFIFELLPQP